MGAHQTKKKLEVQNNVEEQEIKVPSEINNSTKSLSDDFRSMLDNEYLPDVDIRCGPETFKAHKCVLGTRSTIFRATLENPAAKSSTVTVEDIEPAVFRVFLSFLYGGQIEELDVPTACALLHAAEKYQIGTLKQKCSDFLQNNLTVENCLDILQCADIHDQRLKVDVLTAIAKMFPDLQSTQSWVDFQESNPVLALKVFSRVVEEFQDEKKPG